MAVFGADFRGLPIASKVAVGVASVLVLAPNNRRRYAIFVNDSDTVIYLTLGDRAAIDTGIRLNALGGNYEINVLNYWSGAVSAISSGAAKNLTVQELD